MTGVFNGTGLDINSAAFVQNFPGFANQSAQVILYFQHHSGDLRWAGLNDSGWFGGGPNQTIATDAKNATSISTAAFAYNSKNYWRIYCKSYQGEPIIADGKDLINDHTRPID